MAGSIPDERYERLARYLLPRAERYMPEVEKHIVEVGFLLAPEGHYWSLTLLLHDVYRDTPVADGMASCNQAMAHVVTLLKNLPPP
jgi:hypothetical protein